MEHDDKCFHPSAVSLSVSLLVGSETGSALTLIQEDKLFFKRSKDQKKKKKWRAGAQIKKDICETPA